MPAALLPGGLLCAGRKAPDLAEDDLLPAGLAPPDPADDDLLPAGLAPPDPADDDLLPAGLAPPDLADDDLLPPAPVLLPDLPELFDLLESDLVLLRVLPPARARSTVPCFPACDCLVLLVP
ncbi:MAG: hypothetical protein J5842_03320 [Lachnospiraceae bacterium]|nr:hypothetical protein [Lachnospiraceae bacterium]